MGGEEDEDNGGGGGVGGGGGGGIGGIGAADAASVGMGDDMLTQDAILSSTLGAAFGNVAQPGTMLRFSDLEMGIRRRDARIRSLTAQLETETKRREALAERVTQLSDAVARLEADRARLADAAAQYDDVKRRHDVLLELLGESEERCEGLRADLEDVKSKFREQIEGFLVTRS